MFPSPLTRINVQPGLKIPTGTTPDRSDDRQKRFKYWSIKEVPGGVSRAYANAVN